MNEVGWPDYCRYDKAGGKKDLSPIYFSSHILVICRPPTYRAISFLR